MRDRLDSLKGKKSQKSKPINNEAEINMDETTPFTDTPVVTIKNTFERTEVIQQWLDSLESNNDQIRNKIRNFHATFNQNDLNLKLEDLFANNKAICFKVNNKLKECEAELKTIDNHSAQSRIKKIQHNGTKKRYMELFKANMSLMQDHSDKIKQKIISETAAKNIRITPEELQTIIDNGQDIQVFTDNVSLIIILG
ncbi:unnamed protein product [Brassicogethes aeneus]|uniref:Uncharacterized protein n=1 Tax=Brassicogethes aeneus TaxID=1431903 RepID=A0A9P0FI92_BRAAE|nr:unnamed protein product [Brassicogethes aeneus]